MKHPPPHFILIYFISSALVLCFAAGYNEFPLVTSDTGAYISNFFGNLVPLDRPITYSIFIYFASWHISAWLPILMQSIWLSGLIFLVIESTLPIKNKLGVSFFFILALSMLTSVSWYSSQLMADIFTSMSFLSLYVLCVNKNLTRFKRNFLYTSLLFSVLMHNSNILIIVLFLVGVMLLLRTNLLGNQTHYVRLKGPIITTLSAALLLASIHLVGGYGFTLSRSTDVFLVGKMCENGVMESYLKSNCEERNYYICDYKDNLPTHAWEFMWSGDGAFAAGGGWEGTKKQNKEILRGIFTSPEHLLLYIKQSIKDTFIQFLSWKIGDGLNPHLETGNAYKQIQKYFSNELHDYKKSKQSRSQLTFDFLNYFYLILILFSILVLGFVLFMMRMPITFELKFLLIGVILFLLCNACITASLANVLARLQSRVIWLLPFTCWIILAYLYLIRKKSHIE